ncbi:hypothetical protein AB1Y20_003483 [Prymnesium parvum]|uniref:Protein of centriole 5 n=1 Tax=Prymnesium parvum TaxID=97485 RepID=A0AB34JBT8_PRYPA
MPAAISGGVKRDWRQELRSRVRSDQEEAERRIARVDSPSWRQRLQAVKAQMEESSHKVELAEKEMRLAVASMRDEQGARAPLGSSRQRSLHEMHSLLHGLREEQQGTQLSLHSSRASLRRARAHAVAHALSSGWHLRLGRSFVAWARAAVLMAHDRAIERRSRLEEQLAREVLHNEALSTQLQSGSLELTQRSFESRDLHLRLQAMQESLSRRAHKMEMEALEERGRQLGELRKEHALQLSQMAEEHEESARRSWRRVSRAQDAVLEFARRVAEKRLLYRCWYGWLAVREQARARQAAEAQELAARLDLQAAAAAQLAEARRTAAELREAAEAHELQLAEERRVGEEREYQLKEMGRAVQQAAEASEKLTKQRDAIEAQLREITQARSPLRAHTAEHRVSVAAAQAIALEAAAATAGREAALAVASQAISQPKDHLLNPARALLHRPRPSTFPSPIPRPPPAPAPYAPRRLTRHPAGSRGARLFRIAALQAVLVASLRDVDTQRAHDTHLESMTGTALDKHAAGKEEQACVASPFPQFLRAHNHNHHHQPALSHFLALPTLFLHVASHPSLPPPSFSPPLSATPTAPPPKLFHSRLFAQLMQVRQELEASLRRGMETQGQLLLLEKQAAADEAELQEAREACEQLTSRCTHLEEEVAELRARCRAIDLERGEMALERRDAQEKARRYESDVAMLRAQVPTYEKSTEALMENARHARAAQQARGLCTLLSLYLRQTYGATCGQATLRMLEGRLVLESREKAACERALEESRARLDMAELKNAQLAASMEEAKAEIAELAAQNEELEAQAADISLLREQDTRVVLAEKASEHAAEMAAEQARMAPSG